MKGRSIAYFISSLAILIALLLNACPATSQNVKSKSVGPPSQIPERKITAPPNRKPPIRSAAGSIAVNENPLYNTYTPEQLVRNVLITGCLTASNITFQGLFNSSNPNQRQLGYFEKATSNFPIDEGLILSSGYVTAAEGPNNSTNNSQNLNRAGDPNLTAIAGVATHDAAVLEFDFVPAGNTLEFQYIFSSEEYLEWCCSPYNDAFGFFLTGPGVPGTVNLALIPATAIPVTINNVHQYTANGYNNQPCAAQNAAYYVNNPPGTLSTQFDGMTVVLTATYPVTPCSTYHIKLAVGDAQDNVYNSAVFLKARSFNSEAVGATNVNVNVDIPDFSNIFEGCPANHFILERDPAYISQPVTVYILYGGTATNGADVVTFPGPPNPLPTVVNIPAEVSSYDISYIAVDDGPGDAGEKLDIQILQSCPCDPNPVYLTKTLTIYEQDLAITATGNNVDCGAGSSGSITVNALHGSGDNLFSIDGGNTWQTSNLFTNLAPGDYTILAKNVGSCGTTSTTGTVGAPNPIVAGAGPDGTICSGDSYQLNGSGGTVYSWSPQTGLSDPEIPNPFASPTVTTTYTVTVSDIDGNCTPSTDEVTVYVNPSPVIGITPFNRNICIGSSITLTASGGETYLWNLVPAEATQSITKTPLTSTSYTVIVTGPNGCKADSTANVVVHPLPTAVLSGGATVCSGLSAQLTLNLTGTAPWTVTYLAGVTPVTIVANSPTYTFNVTPATTTTYTLSAVKDYWGCDALPLNLSGSATVTVNPLPIPPTSATVNRTDFCPGAFPSITLTATGGSGTSINWYSGSCNGTFVRTVAFGDPLTIVPPVTTTTYFAHTVNSCGISVCPTASVTVTIKTPPTAPTGITPNKSSSYCINSLPALPKYTLTAVGAGTGTTGFEWFNGASCGDGKITDSARYQLQLPANPTVTTTYYVRNTNAECGASVCASITINVYTSPTAPTSVTASPNPVCAGNNLTLTAIGGDGGTGSNPILKWYSGGCGSPTPGNTGTPLTITAPTSNTTYYARWESSCGNSNCQSVVVSINPLPTLYTVTGGGAYCSGSPGVAVGLSNSQSGVNYQLFNGVTAVGSAVAGTGSPISFGNQTAGGTYTVVATNATTACVRNMTGSVFITINPLPTTYTVTGGGAYCSGGSGVAVGLSGSEIGINYQLYNGASAVGSPLTGTGSPISFGNQTAGGTYSVVATNAITSCTQNMTGSVSISIQLASLFNVTGGGSFCAGGSGLSVGLSGSEVGVNYQLYRGVVPVAVGVPLAGTGGPLDFGIQSAGVNYTVTAIYASPPNCTRVMTGNVSVTSVPLPIKYNVTGTSGTICEGGPGIVIGLSNSQSGANAANYQLYNGATAVGSAVAGTGSAISFGSQTAAGTYTVVATRNSTPFCTNTMNLSVTINVNPAPTITLGASPVVCPSVASTTANLPYSATTNGPDQYSIVYSGAALTAGFVDVTNASLPVSPIVLIVPASAPEATYDATLKVRNSSTGCISISYPITITVGDLIAPVAKCKDIIVNLDATGNATITGAMVDNGSTDNCGIASLSVSPSTFSCTNASSVFRDLIISEYVEGNLTNKNIEIYNGTAAPINLNDYKLQLFVNGSTTVSQEMPLSGTLAPGATVVCKSTGSLYGGAALIDNAVLNFSGDDALALYKISTGSYIDIFGRIGDDPGSAWILGGNTTLKKTLRRKATVTAGITISPTGTGPTAFSTLASEWDMFNVDDVSELGSHNVNSVINTVTLTVTDVSGNKSTCTSNVTVLDNNPPVPLCRPVTAFLDATGNASITASQVDNGSTSACGIQSITVFPNTFNCTNVGAANTVTLTVTDIHGNVATCTAIVTVQDNIAPAAVCKPATVQLNALGTVTITPADVDGGSSDNCTSAGSLTKTVSPNTFTCANVGANTVTLTVKDAQNNTSTCTAIVTVQDLTPPTAVCKDITVQLDALGNASITAAQIDGGSSDACGIKSVTIPPTTTISCSDLLLAPTTELFISEYIEGSSNNKAIEIYNGTGAPINLATGNYKLLLYYNGSSTVGFTINLSGIVAAGDVFVVANSGAAIANIIAQRDQSSGNLDFNGNDVIVLQKGSTNLDIFGKIGQDPGALGWTATGYQTADRTLIRKPNIIQGNIADATGFPSLQTEWDIAGVDVTTSLGSHFRTGSGIKPVVLTVTDNNNNVSTCTANVTVQDILAPVITCPVAPAPICSTGSYTQTGTSWDATATDNCGTPTLSYSLSGATSGTGTSLNGKIFNTGVTTVTWTATDTKGNVSTCSFAVTIIAKPADPTLGPASVCSGTMPQFTAGNGSIYEFFVNNVSQGLPSATPTFTPTVPLVATQPVCVRSYANPVFTFDGILNEAAWGQSLATSAGGPVSSSFGSGNNMDAIYMQSGSGYIFGFIAGNLISQNNSDKILLFIDCQTGGFENLSAWGSRLGAPYRAMQNLNGGTTFDAGFAPDYIMGINQNYGNAYFDLYNMVTNTNVAIGVGGTGFFGFNANSGTGDITHGFEFAIPRSALGNPTGTIKIFAMLVNEPAVGNATNLSNQFLTKADSWAGSYGVGAVTFSAATPNPITVTLSNESCYSEKCVIVNQTPTTSAIYHQ